MRAGSGALLDAKYRVLARTCAPEMDRAIRGCDGGAIKRLEPTPLDRTLCHAWIAKTSKCGDQRRDEGHCIELTKAFSDPILAQLADCMERPCKGYANCGRCEIAVLGGDFFEMDPVVADRDRQYEFLSSPLPDAGPAQARLQGRIGSDAGNVFGATVCLRGFRRRPLPRSSDSGAFALDVPAHSEIALPVVAAGCVPRMPAGRAWGRTRAPGDTGARRGRRGCRDRSGARARRMRMRTAKRRSERRAATVAQRSSSPGAIAGKASGVK